MQVFKAFLKIAKKHLPMAMIYVGIFIGVALIMANSGSTEKSYTQTRLKINVIDEDNSSASKALIDYIGTKHALIEVENDKDSLLDALYYETINYALVIQKGYEEKLLNGSVDQLFYNYQVHTTYAGTLFENDLDAYVKALSAYLAGNGDLEKSLAETKTVLSSTVDVEVKNFSEGKITSEYQTKFGDYFRYLPYIFISILISALCPVLITMNEKEVRNRTNCSSLSPSKYTLQIFLGSSVFVFLTWVVFMITGMVFGGDMYSGKAWMGVLNSFVFVLVSAGIAILVATLVHGKQIVNLIANIVALGMCFLCGVFVPQSLMGDGVMKASRFLPAYWYTKANDLLMESVGDTYDVTMCLTYIGIQAIFVVALFAVILLVTKTKQEAKA